MSVDERFTLLADRITQGFGTWQVFCFFALTILIWAAWGPFVHFSDSWQLWINTPTTIVELFQEIFILAAANRVERHNAQQLDRLLVLEEKQKDEELLALIQSLDRKVNVLLTTRASKN